MTPVPSAVEQARAELAHRGFTKVAGVLAASDVALVEAAIDALVARAHQSPERTWRALVSKSVSNEPSHPEVCRPALLNRALQRTPVFVQCRDVAAALLGCPAHYLFDHAIYKLPWSTTGVHWHQDQAYMGPAIPIRSVHLWIPFQDVDTAAGCLRFVPASHAAAMRPHSRAYDAHPHILRADIAEPAEVVDQPLRLGDIGVHTNLTLHASGPNRTGRTRKAWIIHFGDRPRWYKHLLRAGANLSRRKASARSAPGTTL